MFRTSRLGDVEPTFLVGNCAELSFLTIFLKFKQVLLKILLLLPSFN